MQSWPGVPVAGDLEPPRRPAPGRRRRRRSPAPCRRARGGRASACRPHSGRCPCRSPCRRSARRGRSGWLTRPSPTGTPSPVITLKTPGGKMLLRELGEPKRRKRRLLGRLDDRDVPGRERRAELPDGHHQRVVPRRDAGRDTDGLATDHRRVATHVLAGALPLETARGAGEEAQVVRPSRAARPGQPRSACRRSCDSSWASSSACSSIVSASASSIAERSPGVCSSHSGSARWRPRPPGRRPPRPARAPRRSPRPSRGSEPPSSRRRPRRPTRRRRSSSSG